MSSKADSGRQRDEEAVTNRELSNGSVVEGSATDVDFGTISTTDPSPNNNGGILPDGSVISGTTDHASIDGVMNPSSSNITGNIMPLHSAAPVQVIVDSESFAVQHEKGTVTAKTSAPPVFEQQKHSDPSDQPSELKVEKAHSNPVPTTPAIADHTPPSDTEPVSAQPTSVASDPVVTTPPSQQKQQVFGLMNQESRDSLDDYIRSPEIQNAIVERSPGGRYVRFLEKLGSGASKDVYRAYDTQEGIEVAWNVVTLSGVPKNERNRIVNEVRLLERLHHANIISFHGSWVNRERQEVNFVTEILSSGTLKSFINKVQVIRWKIAKRWAVQILKGLEYLHSQEPPVIHRDLKCENIFINGTSGDLRIGDLGLSTVHRNGRKLSVLGTPEFMAPDMYDDRPYDEKVDIYAFGMCMLEIFTKEIPYSECSNPGQIYKKVYAGEPPEILSRLQSRHARAFVEYCMGFKDENGIYVRPSATELLTHPFLMKRSNDDDEVVVERPLRERTIAETTENSNGSSLDRRRQESHHHTAQGSCAISEHPMPAPSTRQQHETSPYVDADGNDHFDEMPESETNMKKVKVLMGRDQVLNEDDDDLQRQQEVAAATSQQSEAISVQLDDSSLPTVATVVQYNQEVVSSTHAPDVGLTQADDSKKRHYLVAAAVIEDEGPDVRPYADDILKLVVTLPVEGQTQNVQFEFHLVEDDAVQVAKEMVQELDIPEDAVLEISETISGLACAARMRQDKYSARKKTQVQEQVANSAGPPNDTLNVTNSIGGVAAAPETMMSQPTERVILSGHELPSYAIAADSSSNIPVEHQLPGSAPPTRPPLQHGQVHPAVDTTRQPVHGSPGVSSNSPETLQTVYRPGQSQETKEAPPQATEQPQPAYQSASEARVPHVLPQALHTQSQSLSEATGQPVVAAREEVPTNNRSTPIQTETPVIQGMASLSSHGQTKALLDTAELRQQSAAAIAAESTSAAMIEVSFPQLTGQSGIQTAPMGSAAIAVETPTGVPSSYMQPPRSYATFTGDSAALGQGELPSLRTVINGMSPASRKEELYHLADEMNDEVREKLRKLEEDYQKNLKIAKKVFDSRMENLERSQTEKEAQHQKFLEKHEKERAAFEKRRALEEEQQMRRIELLQKEWDKKREILAQQMSALSAAETEAEQQAILESAVVGANWQSLAAVRDQQEQQTAMPQAGAIPVQRGASSVTSNATSPDPALQPP